MKHRSEEHDPEPWRRSDWYRSLSILAWAGLAGLGFLCLTPWIGWNQGLEVLSHFYFQYAMLGLLLPPIFLLLKRYLSLLTALLLCAWNAYQILPWYLPAPPTGTQTTAPVQQDAQAPRLKILMSNILYENPQLDPLKALIAVEKPDVVILQELHPRHLELMKSFKDYRYELSDSGVPHFGIGLWSRWPLATKQALQLGPAHVPSLFVTLRLGNRSLQLLTTHPPPPVDRQAMHLRNAQFTALAGFLKAHPGSQLLIGDLNLTPWSPYYRQLIDATGLRNARFGRGLLPSWRSDMPPGLRIPIDQALYSPDIKVDDLRIGPELGSDHLPLLLSLSFEPLPSPPAKVPADKQMTRPSADLKP